MNIIACDVKGLEFFFICNTTCHIGREREREECKKTVNDEKKNDVEKEGNVARPSHSWTLMVEC